MSGSFHGDWQAAQVHSVVTGHSFVVSFMHALHLSTLYTPRPEAAILDWYGYVLISKCMHKDIKCRGMLSQENLGTLKLLLRPCLGQN